MPLPIKGFLLGLAGFGLFSLADSFIKYLGLGYSPVQIMAFANLFTLPLIGLMWLRARVPLWPVYPGLMLVRTAALIVNGFLVTYAFTVIPLAQAYAIFFTMPFMITMLAWPILGDKVDLKGGLTIVLGLVGVFIALRPGEMTFGPGHLAAILGTMFAAVHYLIIRKTGPVEAMVPMLMYPALGQTAAAMALLPQVYQPMPLADLGLVAGLSVSGFSGTLLMIAAYRVAPPVVVAPAQYSQIAWAAILGGLLFGEPMTLNMVLGMVVIAVAGFLVVARQDRP